MIKSKFSELLFIGLSLSLIASCATTKPASDDNKANTPIIEDTTETVTEKVKKEPKQIAVKNTTNQQESAFKDLVDSIELKVVSKPKTVYAKNPFNTSYVVNVANAEGPVKDFDITVSYPTSRTNDTITYNNIQLKTDEKGNITFSPDVPKFPVKDEVTFYPTPVSSNSTVVQAAYNAAVKAPYTVKSNYVTYPYGILFVYDYNESGKPTTNNFTLLQSLRNSGVSVGNAPVSNTSYFSKPISELYTATHSIVGNAYNFLVSGTFKYAEPAVESEGSATVKLVADITCVDMKNGNILYKTKIEDSATDKTKWNAEQKCKKTLAEKVSDAIIYGM